MPASPDAIDPILLENKLCNLLIARLRDYAIFMLNPEGKIMTWNDGARLIKGYTRDEIVGRSMSMFYTPEDRERGRPAQLLRDAVEHGRVEDEGWRVRQNYARLDRATESRSGHWRAVGPAAADPG